MSLVGEQAPGRHRCRRVDAPRAVLDDVHLDAGARGSPIGLPIVGDCSQKDDHCPDAL
jgi:hypothetical protein